MANGSGEACAVEWLVKRSLIDYMATAGDFEVETSGGAEFSLDDGALIPAVRAADGIVRMTGAVVLRAHGGALAVPIVDGEIAEGMLSIADPVEEGERMALVAVEEIPGVDGSERRWSAKLADDADVLFQFTYGPRTPFDDVVVRAA